MDYIRQYFKIMNLDDFDFLIFENKSKEEIHEILDKIDNGYEISHVLVGLGILNKAYPLSLTDLLAIEIRREIDEEVAKQIKMATVIGGHHFGQTETGC